jgi:hypothetical protein
MIGGRQDDVIFSPRVHFFNSEIEEWTEGPELTVGRVYHSCGIMRKDSESRIVVAGGMIREGSILEYKAWTLQNIHNSSDPNARHPKTRSILILDY